jgi:hypothetical protein
LGMEKKDSEVWKGDKILLVLFLVTFVVLLLKAYASISNRKRIQALWFILRDKKICGHIVKGRLGKSREAKQSVF